MLRRFSWIFKLLFSPWRLLLLDRQLSTNNQVKACNGQFCAEVPTQSFNQLISQPASQSINQSASHPVSQTVSQSINHLSIIVFICRFMCVWNRNRGDSLLRTVMGGKWRERKQEEDLGRRWKIGWWFTDNGKLEAETQQREEWRRRTLEPS